MLAFIFLTTILSVDFYEKKNSTGLVIYRVGRPDHSIFGNHIYTAWFSDENTRQATETDWFKVKRMLITLGYMEDTEVKETRDKVEDLYIKESGCFAFLDERKISPRYIEWLERRVLHGPNE